MRVNEQYYSVAAVTLAVVLLGHAIYIGYRMGRLTQALEDMLRRMVDAEVLANKVFQIDDMLRRMDRMEAMIERLLDK